MVTPQPKRGRSALEGETQRKDVRPNPTKRSVSPDGRYPTKDVAGDRHMADGRERKVSGHQRLAGRRQFPQKKDPDAGRFLGVVFEAVVPVGVVEPDCEHEVPGES